MLELLRVEVHGHDGLDLEAVDQGEGDACTVFLDKENWDLPPIVLNYMDVLEDDELAAVLTYVRNSWGNKASAITPQEVAKVRKEIKNVTGMYNPADLLKEHPYER